MVQFSFRDNEVVSSPLVIVSGTTNVSRGAIQFTNNGNKVFPPQVFEVNDGHFKALVHVSEGSNDFKIEVFDNGSVDPHGFAAFNGQPHVADKGRLQLHFNQLPQNKPVHLCLILGKDSNGSYDLPAYKRQRGEQANLDTAIRKLKVAGRLMQAFTQDEFRRLGMSNRSFQFVEETVLHQGIFGYNVESPTPHQEVKIHVLRSPMTVAELRNPDFAQQNPKGKKTGELFGHANHIVLHTPEIFSRYKQGNTAMQVACVYLDSTYDAKMDMILTHAALGGGSNEIKLAVFGSHGLHSWPTSFAQVTPAFLDATHLGKDVANDCGECGTSWECCNITMGAFMHEIGHSFGSPHQESGVMLRDYIWWNRSFMTRELENLKRNTKGEIIRRDGTWSRACHWHDTDLMRYFYHDSFSIPVDDRDLGLRKVYSTTMKPDNSYSEAGGSPTSFPNHRNGVNILCDSGIYMVEFCSGDLARVHHDYLPKSYRGPGLQHEIELDFDECFRELKKHKGDADDRFGVRVLSVAGDLYIDDLKKLCSAEESKIRGDFGRGNATITGFRGQLMGHKKDKPEQVIGLDMGQVEKIRIYHGGALDGIRFFFSTSGSSGAPPVPARNYLDKLSRKLKEHTIAPKYAMAQKSALIGNEKPEYSEFVLGLGEQLTRINIRHGGWIDAVQFQTNKRRSDTYGNATGGLLSLLEVPRGFNIIGLYGYCGAWLDGIGVVYA